MANIAMLLAQDFEDSEFTVPFDRAKELTHQVTVIGSKAGEVVVGKRRQAKATADAAARDADPKSFDALVIPGGYSPDHLRLDEYAVSFTRQCVESGMLVAAICHGPQLLIEAEVVKGRTLTSWPSVRKDLENAGAKWVNREVVVDENLITSRKPEDLDAFCEEIFSRLAGGIKQRRAAGRGAR